MKILTTGSRFLAGLLTLLVILVNLRLYSAAPSQAYGLEKLGPDILPQLQFIGRKLHQGAGEEMQGLFPEGYFFSHTLYGLSWVEVGLRSAPETDLHNQAIQEAYWALEQIESPKGKAPFPFEQKPAYGIFYAGWSNWLRGGVLMLQTPEKRPKSEVEQFQKECKDIAEAFEQSDLPFLAAYPSQTWPVDSVVAIAALRLHDKLYPARFTSTIERWKSEVHQYADASTGLLPHRVNYRTGEALEGPRGSSQSLIMRFLLEIDPIWLQTQYASFRQQFIRPVFGIYGTHEYPPGVFSLGDVDSGPLIGGVSLSATVVSLATAQVYADNNLADAYLQSGEAMGFPWQTGAEKSYAFGLLPVGDAFLVWAKTSSPWVAEKQATALPPLVPWHWRLPVQLASAVFIIILWLADLRKFSRRFGRQQRK